MLVGAVVTGLVGVGITIGGAAAGAHYASASNKAAGAALGCGAGILASGVISLLYAAATGDQMIATSSGAKISTEGRRFQPIAGAPQGLPPASPVIDRLTTVGPFVTRK